MPQRAKRMPGKRIKPKPRESAARRGYGHRWRKEARRWLAVHPLCAECQRNGKLVPATQVDHIRPHKGDAEKFWDLQGNLQSLCGPCHWAKTMRGE